MVYGSDQEFLAATVPFCLDGLEEDDAVLAVTTKANIDLLRQQLGSSARDVEFIVADEWYRAPGRTLAAYYRYVDERTGAGPHQRVRVIGEPVWHGRDVLETDEWTRYESAINVAFADCPAWIVCPYDTRVLPASVVADARRTHPQLVSGAAARASGHYAAPLDGAWGRTLSPVPSDGRAVLRFDADLSAVRPFVARAATSLGMSSAGADRLVFAVNEVATNAVQHGGGAGEVALWRSGHRVVCDVRDSGGRGGSVDGHWMLGYMPPESGRARGHGLWTVRQLCDVVEVEPGIAGTTGTTVRLHLNLA
ncbi:hypothetical protein AMK16_24915 [Streptomyces sp. CB00455]|nr:hypothetical protein AMK16_24915 [Streptomyces sp. CB00455]